MACLLKLKSLFSLDLFQMLCCSQCKLLFSIDTVATTWQRCQGITKLRLIEVNSLISLVMLLDAIACVVPRLKQA